MSATGVTKYFDSHRIMGAVAGPIRALPDLAPFADQVFVVTSHLLRDGLNVKRILEDEAAQAK